MVKKSKRYSIIDCLEIGHKLFTCGVVYMGWPATSTLILI